VLSVCVVLVYSELLGQKPMASPLRPALSLATMKLLSPPSTPLPLPKCREWCPLGQSPPLSGLMRPSRHSTMCWTCRQSFRRRGSAWRALTRLSRPIGRGHSGPGCPGGRSSRSCRARPGTRGLPCPSPARSCPQRTCRRSRPQTLRPGYSSGVRLSLTGKRLDSS
jgi:hypothetical protein